MAFLAPRSETDGVKAWSKLVVADVRTGADLVPRLAATRVWSYRPSVCTDKRTFCIEAGLDDDSHGTYRYRLDRQGDLVPDLSVNAPYLDSGRPISTYLSLAQADDVDRSLRYGHDGRITWSRAYPDVFGEGADTTLGTERRKGTHWTSPRAERSLWIARQDGRAGRSTARVDRPLDPVEENYAYVLDRPRPVEFKNEYWTGTGRLRAAPTCSACPHQASLVSSLPHTNVEEPWMN